MLLFSTAAFTQTDWPSYGNDPGAMRYSSLRQIDQSTIQALKPAWTFRTGKSGSESIPIVVDGVMYVTAPDGVYALVPETVNCSGNMTRLPLLYAGWRIGAVRA